MTSKPPAAAMMATHLNHTPEYRSAARHDPVTTNPASGTTASITNK